MRLFYLIAMEETNASAIAQAYAEHISGNGIDATPIAGSSIRVQFDNLSTNEIYFGSVNDMGWHTTSVSFEENYVVIKCYDRQPYLDGAY